jgi:hypothetical protein
MTGLRLSSNTNARTSSIRRERWVDRDPSDLCSGLLFGVVLAMAATSSKPQSDSAPETPIHRPAHC